MIDLTQVILGLFTLVGTVVTAVLVPYIRSRTTIQQQAEIDGWVRVAVAAAEQIYSSSGQGEQKKIHVIQFLRNKGISVNEETLDAMIEAAVYQLKNGIVASEVFENLGGIL